jgi:fructan beta-fructosidase
MRPTFLLTLLAVSTLLLISSIPPEEKNNEKYRPQYHFSLEKSFLGNTAGLVFQDGDYHIFYQYNPSGKEAADLHFGHAKSKDLFHWEYLPETLKPGGLPGDTVCNSFLSGCVIVDKDNVLNLQQGGTKTQVLYYTENQCGLQMAFSPDQGKTWKKYAQNPIIPYDKNNPGSYLQVFWHAASKKWVMALYNKPDNDKRKQGFSFYNSDNLTTWEFQSHLAGFFENPSIMELRVNNRPDDTRWVVMEGNGNYIVGIFNGKTFTPESIRLKSDFGVNLSAPQTFFNIPAGDGRIIQMAGMKDGEWTDMPFSGQLTVPVELSLKKVNTGIFLSRQPVKEIEKLYGKQYVWKNENLIPGINKNLIKKIQGDCFRIKGRFDLKNCDAFGFMLKNGKKNPGAELMYNVKRQTLSLLGQQIGLAPIDNKISLDILVDRASAEVFANGGIASVSSLIFNPENDKDFILFNSGGELMVEELTITEINSIWRTEKK